MPTNRDDFSAKTKELLAKRVGYRCSNPACRKLTCGANDNPSDFTNIGVAAHICAAADGGPRYDRNMSSVERKNYANGIWLCQSCSKLIDSDISRYTVDKLNRWKSNAEEATYLELEEASHELSSNTIIAFNTGILRTRDGDILKQAEGKSVIQNSDWRDKLFAIVEIMTAIRRRLKIAKKDHSFIQRDDNNGGFYIFHDRELEEWFDSSREEVLKIMSSICREAGLHELYFPKRHYRW